MESDTTKRLIGALILTAVIIFMGLIIPLTMGLGTASIHDPGVGETIDFYQKFYWSLTVIWAVFIAFIFIRKNNKYGDSIGFFGIGKKPALSFFKRFSGFQLTLLSLITFFSIFLMANVLKTGSFTSLQVLPQQFSPTQSLLFSTLLIPVSENLLIGAIIALTLLGITLLAMKYKISESEYTSYIYIALFIIGGTFGVLWHLTAYPSSDLAKYVILMFWGIGAVISVATGLFMVFLIMHMANNFAIDFSRLYSSDTLLIVAVSVIIGLIVLYGWLYRNNLWGQGAKSKPVLV